VRPVFRSLRVRLLLASTLVEFIMLALLVANSVRLINEAMLTSADSAIEQMVPTLNVIAAGNLVAGDLATLQDNLNAIVSRRDQGLAYVVIDGADGERVFAGNVSPDDVPKPHADSSAALSEPILHVERPIRLGGQQVGTMQFGLSTAVIARAKTELVKQGLIIATVEIVLTFALLSLVGYWLTRHFESFIVGSQAVAEGRFDRVLPVEGHDEVAQLATNFNRMTEAVRSRIDALAASEARYRELFEQATAAKAELEHYRQHLEELVDARTEDLAAANRELEAFSYSVSHDLRAPVRSIGSFAGILKKDYGPKLDDEGRDFLDRIARAASRMGDMTEALLALSRVARAELRREPCNVSAIAADMCEELRRIYGANGATFRIEAGLNVVADSRLMSVLMQNLLANAWKFSSRRPDAVIEVGELRGAAAPTFFVRDNGVGFNATQAHRLFAPFQRLHSKAAFEGTGIGLATVKRIVLRHGGRVWAEGASGKGATFLFEIPPEKCDEHTADHPPR